MLIQPKLRESVLAVLVASVTMAAPMRALAQPCSGVYLDVFRDACAPPIFILLPSISLDSTLCGASNDFDLGPLNSCTGRSAPGPDLQLLLRYPDDCPPCWIHVELDYCDGAPFDGAIYLLQDCSNPLASCVVGSDNPGVGVPEVIDALVVLSSTQPLTLVVDSQGPTCGRFGIFVTANCIPCETGTERGTWGGVKSLYR